MTDYPTATPRIASYLLLEKNGKYAFLKRANTGWRDGYYGLPAGKVEKGESYKQAAIREAKEEIGVILEPQNLCHILTSHRTEDASDWVDIVFIATSYEGKPHNVEPHKHSELAWLDLDDLPDTVYPSLRFMLDQYSAGTSYTELGWE